MAEQAHIRIQESMTTLVDDIDKNFLRSKERDMHLCAAKCCEMNEASVEQVHRCVEGCNTNLVQIQTYVQKELSEFQERLQRCILVCQDKVKDRVTSNLSESHNGDGSAGSSIMSSMGRALRDATLGQGGVSIYKAEFEACALGCVDDHIKLLPNIRRKIAENITKNF